MMGGIVRVVVVDDSPLAVGLMRELLECEAGLVVVGVAEDGAGAVDRVLRDRPDIVVMDIGLPGMNGIEATRVIMERAPCPILLVSGARSRVEGQSAYEALSVGALDVVLKPGVEALDEGSREGRSFRRLVRVLSAVRVVHLRRRYCSDTPQPAPGRSGEAVGGLGAAALERAVCIGSSTGGPPALCSVLRRLPPSLPAPVVITHHITRGFAAELAQWLGRMSGLDVRLARDGDRIQRGAVTLSPDDRHLTVLPGGWIRLLDSPPVRYQKPSVDVLFESLATAYGAGCVGVVLSGMGSDGARGALAIRAAGGFTIAQDEQTSAIFGMPHAAIELGGIDVVLPIEAIAGRIATEVHRERVR